MSTLKMIKTAKKVLDNKAPKKEPQKEPKKERTKTQKILLGIGISLAVLLIVACGIVDAWYIYLAMYAPDKMTSQTVNIGTIETDTGDKAYMWEVDLFTNANQNGLKCLEIKSTYFTDENKKSLYSQGLQYVADSVDGDIDWYTFDEFLADVNSDDKNIRNEAQDKADLTSHRMFKTGALWWYKEYTASYYSPTLEVGTSKYEYQSLSGSAWTGSTNPLSMASYLTIETANKEMLYMQFKGDNYSEVASIDEFQSDPRKIGEFGNINYYHNYTVDCFAYSMYESVKNLPAGTNGTFVFEFGDNFKYYDVDPTTSTGEEIQSLDYDLVKNEIKSYYTIKVNVSADGIKNSSQSMFGLLHGSPNYSVAGDTTTSDYFAGKTLIECSVEDFQLVKVSGQKVALKLKDSFIEQYKPYAHSIALCVTIDNDAFEERNLEYIGFTADSGLENFEIFEINIINQEVA